MTTRILYSDIDRATNVDYNFESLVRQLNLGVSHDDMMMVIYELTDKISVLGKDNDGIGEEIEFQLEEQECAILEMIDDLIDRIDDHAPELISKDQVMEMLSSLSEDIGAR